MPILTLRQYRNETTMVQRDNILSFGESVRGRRFVLDDKSMKAANGCREIIIRTLPRLTDSLFEKLDDALFDLADKAENDSRQSVYFDAMREVRKQRGHIQDDFNRGIQEQFDRFWPQEPEAAPAQREEESPPKEFSLMEEGDLEESLAVNDMISKGENRYDKGLYALEQRFSHMAKGAEVNNRNNPIAPAAICHRFRESLEGLAVDIQVKLVIYKLFDKQVMQCIGGMYDEIGASLGNARILPKLMPRIRRNSAAPVVHGRREGRLPETLSLDEGNYAGEVEPEIFSALQQLLVLHRQQGGAPAPGATVEAAALPVAEASELLGALSALQQANMALASYVPKAPAEVNADIKKQLLEQLQSGERKALGQVDDDTIDVVSMLFEFILEDESLPDAMKALLSRLQIPMLKVAILDKAFLSRKGHPARRLLNNLGRAAFGWSEGDDHSKDSLYHKIESSIKCILEEFGDDISLFDEVNQEFADFLENEQRGARVTEERTAQIVQGKEQLKLARKQVAEEINGRLKGRGDMPEAVISLLTKGWKDVLLLICLRQGQDSKAWANALSLVDRILWSVEPKSEHAERQKLLKEIPALLKELRKGLNSISYDQHKMARLFKELQICHITSLHPDPADPKPARPLLSKEEETEEITAPLLTEDQVVEEIVLVAPSAEMEGDANASEAVEHDEYAEQAGGLEVGSWLEIKEEDGIRIRAKLSWKSVANGSLVLVNRRGVKVAEMSVNGLAMRLRAGNVRVLEEMDVPLMDRALSSMVETLKNMEENRPIGRER